MEIFCHGLDSNEISKKRSTIHETTRVELGSDFIGFESCQSTFHILIYCLSFGKLKLSINAFFIPCLLPVCNYVSNMFPSENGKKYIKY